MAGRLYLASEPCERRVAIGNRETAAHGCDDGVQRRARVAANGRPLGRGGVGPLQVLFAEHPSGLFADRTRQGARHEAASSGSRAAQATGLHLS